MTQKKPFKELQFSDAFMFAAVMEDEEICRGVLERVLGIPIRNVRVRTEAALLVNPDFRGVRLDVHADDEQKTVFDVEMQTTNKHNLPKRSRGYQGQLDMMLLRPGIDFKELPKSFIIFICTFDPFGHGRYRYTIDSRCRETGEEFGDEAYKIFLNTKGGDFGGEPEELVHFLKYVEDAEYGKECISDSLIQKIDTRVKQIMRERGMEVQYMLFGEMLDDEREEGRTEGQNRLLRLISSMKDGGDVENIFLLGDNPELLRSMYDKYHVEA